MGYSKRMIEEPTDVCEECGAPLEANDDGEIECTANVPCLRQVIASEQSQERSVTPAYDAGMRKKIKKMKRDQAARLS